MDNLRRGALETLRDLLAVQLLEAGPRDLPSLGREYRAVLKELADLPVEKEANPLVDIGDARARRQARAKVS